MSIGPVDAGILAVYLLGVVAFGVWIGRGQNSLASYTVGDRNLPWWLLLFSIVATETSTVTFLSIPGFSYGRDLTWLQIPFGFLLGRFVVAWVLMPLYFRGQFSTAYEVLRLRFAGATQQVASAMFVVAGLATFLVGLEAVEPLAQEIDHPDLTESFNAFADGLKQAAEAAEG